MRVAIIGAGPAGLTLALALLRESIEVAIFERDLGPTSRPQGGTLDLHTTTGLAALKRIGLYDEFLKHARFDGEAFTMVDSRNRRYVEISGGTEKTSNGRPEIDRTKLRDMLLKAIPQDCIQWNTKLVSIEKDLTLRFEDRTLTGFDLVVGADGAWSKVRPYVSPVRPAYTGVTGMHWRIPKAADRFPELHSMIDQGLFCAYEEGTSLMGQQIGDGSISVTAWLVKDEEWANEMQVKYQDPAMLKEKILELYDGWAPDLRRLIQVADEQPFWADKIYHLPVGHKWLTKGNVTLIGDAAHVSLQGYSCL